MPQQANNGWELVQSATSAPGWEPVGSATATPPKNPGFFKSLFSDLSAIVKPQALNPYPGMGQEEKSEAAEASAGRMRERSKAGYSPLYQAVAPVAESIGVNVAGMEESAKAGDPGGVLGHAAAVPVAAGTTEVLGRATARIPKVRESLQGFARKATGVEPAVTEAVDKAVKGFKEDTAKHAKKSAQVTEENNAAEQARDMRKRLEGDLKTQTDAYYAKETEVQKKAGAENDANWNKWREKVKDVQVDMTPVREAIDKVGAEFPEAKKLLSATEPSPEGQSVGNQQFLADRTAVMKQQGYGADYEALSPERKGQVDSLMERMGLAPEESDGIDASQPMSVQKLHELKSRIGWKLARNEYPPDITGAMKQAYKALEKQETRGSIEANALDELKTARESHQQYQGAFGRSRSKRTVQGEVRKKAANPQAFKEQEEQNRLAAVGKYDPELAKAHQGVVDARKRLSEVPTEEKLRKGLQQQPSAPEAPTIDIRQETRDAIATRAKNWGNFNARDIGILGSSLIGGPILWMLGERSLGGAVVGAGLFEGSKYVASRALRSPAVIDWLAKTPPAEVEALSRIPGADKVKIMDGLTQVAIKSGKPVTLSPAARQFLGPKNVAKIVAATGMAQSNIKNRKDALQALGR